MNYVFQTFDLIIDEAALALQQAMWNDAYNLVEPMEEPGQANRTVIFWQHGTLGIGNRRVVPACLVDVIRVLRVRYPSPTGQYTSISHCDILAARYIGERQQKSSTSMLSQWM